MTALSTDALIAKYDRPVPRYTSFPTAVQFTHEISQETYRGLLSQLDKDEKVSLYLHIPFCHSLCHYCGCHTKITATYQPVGEYIRTLLEEVRLWGYHRLLLLTARVHFGGGSPNFAETEDLSALLSVLPGHSSFQRTPRLTWSATRGFSPKKNRCLCRHGGYTGQSGHSGFR